MFKLFSKNKKKPITECVVLYSFEFDRSNTKELFNFIISYFKSSHNVEFEYAGFYDESYDEKYGNFENINAKLQNSNWNEIVNFSLDVSDLRKRERTIGVEFEITRPVNLLLYFPNDFFFKLDDFLHKCNSVFKIEYGFCYKTTEQYWITSYAIGDSAHSNDIIGIVSLKKKDFERWRQDCEKLTKGFLRGIYNKNILNQAQLKANINGMQLESYVIENSLGSLIFINNDISLWILDDKQVSIAREIIAKTNILI